MPRISGGKLERKAIETSSIYSDKRLVSEEDICDSERLLMQEFAPEPLNTCDLDRIFMLEGSPIKIEESPRPINDYIQTSKKVD